MPSELASRINIVTTSVAAVLPKYGPDGAKAKDLLATRGVTPAVVEEACNLLSQLTKVSASPISQVAIKQRQLLRQLGFFTHHPVEEEPSPPVGGGPVTAPTAPAT